MAGHILIDRHLADLARQLPARAVDELADGLTETYHHHLDRGLDATTAATAAIAEFGHPDQIIAAFTRHAAGRRAAFALLATGPVLAVCWGPSLILGQAWSWPVPVPATLAFGLTMLAVVITLATAATSHHNYPRTRLAVIGAIGLVLLDITMLAAVVLAAPALVWPMALAIPASLIRIGLTARALPRLLVRSH